MSFAIIFNTRYLGAYMEVQGAGKGVEYTLHTDTELRLLGLFGICFLAFLLALILLFVGLVVFAALGWTEPEPSDDFDFLWMAFVLGVPVAVFFLLRKKLRRLVTVRLSPDSLSIQGRGKSIELRKEEIKSYEAFFDDGETFDTETVIVRTISGRNVKLQASTSSGSLKEMAVFRRDFEQWAEAQKLTQWSPWYRRKWGR